MQRRSRRGGRRWGLGFLVLMAGFVFANGADAQTTPNEQFAVVPDIQGLIDRLEAAEAQLLNPQLEMSRHQGTSDQRWAQNPAAALHEDEIDTTGLGMIHRGQDDDAGGSDPSDPTQVTFHVMQEVEWNQLSENQGDTVAYKVSPFIPLKLGEQSFLFNIELPLTNANTDLLGNHTGLGDTRLKLFWLIPTEREFVRAVVPSFDVIAPTGDTDKGLGGGAWILMPNIVFALQPAENLSIYPFLRYVHSDGPRPYLIPDSGIPVPPNGNIESESAETRAFNLELTMTFNLQDAVMDWVSITPDYFQNFTGDKGHTFQMKYEAGVGISESMFLIFKFWHPVSGDVANDFTAGISLDWYPQSGSFGCGCRR